MSVNLTQEERAKVEALKSEYEALRDKLQPLTAWERQAQGEPLPAEVAAAHEALSKAADLYMVQYTAVIDAAEDRHMQSLGNSPADILEDGKDRARTFAASQYTNKPKSAADLDMLRGVLDKLLTRHYDALKGYPVQLTDLKHFKDTALTVIPTDQPNTWVTKTNKMIMPVDNVTRVIFEGTDDTKAGEWLQTYAGNKGKKRLTNLVQINFEDMTGIQISKILKPLDREILGAVCTLFFVENYDIITPLMIYRKMTGDDNARLSPERAHYIMERVRQMAKGWAKVDMTEEMQAFYPGIPGEKWQDEGHLLPIAGIKTVVLGGKEAQVIERGPVPLVYRWGVIRRQIASYKQLSLLTPVKNTNDNMILKSYIMRQFKPMKSGSINRVIEYETLYKLVGVDTKERGAIPAQTRMKQQRTREQVKIMLTYWQSIGDIKGFKERKKGRGYDAIELEF